VILDDIVPGAHFTERHHRHVAAPPEAVWASLLELRLSDSPVSRALMDLRTLGRRGGAAMTSGRFLESGPVPVLELEPPRRAVAGGVLQPWKLGGGSRPPALDGPALRAFAQPGWVKCGVDFTLHPEGGGTLLATETRVEATDPGTRRRFGLYWLLIRFGSGVIRREMLRVVARRAEAGVAG
jgi:hypothetical protein